MGEGLRNTISLRGTGGTRFGNLHWSGNFDEVQDFEAQIEHLNGGEGLIPGQTFGAGVSPLTEVTSGVSADLDALAAYVSGLGKESVRWAPRACDWGDHDCASQYNSGIWPFQAHDCGDCHTRVNNLVGAYRDGATHDMGTIKESSDQRLGLPLTGIRTPPLIELWDTAPYLHDGSASTLREVMEMGLHADMVSDERALTNLLVFIEWLGQQYYLDDDEPFIP